MNSTILRSPGGLATAKHRKLKWYGHVTRSDGLTKVTLQGTIEGKRGRGRLKKRWTDNIAEWTTKSFAETHNQQEWRELMKEFRHDGPPWVLAGLNDQGKYSQFRQS